MAQPTNTFDTYDAVGIREDLQDVIYSISPTETPFMSAAAREQVKNTFHEWQTDSLAAAVTNNKVIEGTCEKIPNTNKSNLDLELEFFILGHKPNVSILDMWLLIQKINIK